MNRSAILRFAAWVKAPGAVLPAIIACVSVILGAYFHLRYLGEGILAHDEVEKYLGAREYLRGRFYADIDHPAMEKYLICLSISIFGHGEWAIRLPNALLGIATIFLVYLIGKKMFDPWTGALASLLLATNTLFIGYATYAKEDAVLAFFVTLAIYAYLRMEGMDEMKRLTRTSVVLGFAMASKFSAIMFSGVFFVVWLWSSVKRAVAERMDGPLQPTVKPLRAWSMAVLAILRRPVAMTIRMCCIMIVVLLLVTPWIIIYFPHFLYCGLGHWAASSIKDHSTVIMGTRYERTPIWFYLPLFLFILPVGLILILSMALFSLAMHARSWVRIMRGGDMGDPGRGSVAQRPQSPLRMNDLLVTAWFAVPLMGYSVIAFSSIRYSPAFMPPLALLGARGIALLHRRIGSPYLLPAQTGGTICRQGASGQRAGGPYGLPGQTRATVLFTALVAALVLSSALEVHHTAPEFREARNGLAHVAGIGEVYSHNEKYLHHQKEMLVFMSDLVEKGDPISADISGRVLDYYLGTDFRALIREDLFGFPIWKPRENYLPQGLFIEDRDIMLNGTRWVIIHEDTLQSDFSSSAYLREYLKSLNDGNAEVSEPRDFMCRLLRMIPSANSIYAFEILMPETD